MVALLSRDGRFKPMPVVKDSGKLKQLVKSMDEKPQAPKGLVAAIRESRKQYKTQSK